MNIRSAKKMLLIAAFSIFGTAAAAFSAAASETDPLSEEARIAAGPAFASAQPAETEAVPETETETEAEAEIAPGVTPLSEADTPDVLEESDLISLGTFTTTGYCNCEKCSGGHNLTYSGTVPQADHTISADLDRLPLNTRVMINGIVYTVEDMGSGVDGNKIDVYYATHEEALAHGLQQAEVFLVSEG